jgi:type II secretion system protein G
MNKHKKQAFTLVELIVVITILAILWTIAFISLQWYSTQARDSNRISDLSTMKSWLELFQVDAGKYPQPTNGIDVTYSWATVWSQGTFWETVYANVEKLDKVPTDPLTDNSYTYSVTSSKTEYQLWGILEWDEVTIRSPLISPYQGGGIDQANAWETTANAIVTWSYNGQITKSNSGTLCNILATPSIITNDTTVTDLQQIVTNSNFVYRWYKNLPGSFAGTKFKQNWWFAYQPATLLAYTDNSSCGDITAKTSSGTTARVQLLKWIQNAYTWTIVKDVWEIKRVLDLTINTSSPSQEVISYAWNFVNNSLWGNIVEGSDSNTNNTVLNSCNSTEPINATLIIWVPTSQNQAWQNINSANACYYNCSPWYWFNWTSCILKAFCDDEQFVSEITLTNWQTWSCMNQWATTVWDWASTLTSCSNSPTNCNSWLTWVWDYYQWWRNEPVNSTSVSTYNWVFTWLLWHNNFVNWEVTYQDWWQNEAWSSSPTRWTWTNPQWPCSTGWHIPSSTEWQSVCNTISWTSCADNSTTVTAMKTKLRLPLAGYRSWHNGNYFLVSSVANYWSSTPNTTKANGLYFNSSEIYISTSNWRSGGFSVRCIKN